MPFMWSAETFIPTEIITVAYNIMKMILISMFCYFVFRQDDMLKALACLDKEEKEKKPEKSHG